MHTRFAFSARYIDTDVDRARYRTTFNVRALPRLSLGVEYNPGVVEFGPLVTWFFLSEEGRRPAAFLGTSSDRIGSPEGKQAYFLTVSKSLEQVPLTAYASLNYSEWDEGINFPFGAYLEVVPGVSVQPMYDGQRTHLLGNYATEQWSASVIWAWLEDIGFAVSFGF